MNELYFDWNTKPYLHIITDWFIVTIVSLDYFSTGQGFW